MLSLSLLFGSHIESIGEIFDVRRCSRYVHTIIVHRLSFPPSHTKQRRVDIAFTNTFMYTHRSFAPPEVIVEKFMQRFDVPPSLDANAAFIVQVCAVVCSYVLILFPNCNWCCLKNNNNLITIKTIIIIDSCVHCIEKLVGILCQLYTRSCHWCF